MEMFLVGGAVRDLCMGRESKDWDFVVVLDDAPSINPAFEGFTPFEVMRSWLEQQGFSIFLSDEQHVTVRARAPKGFTFAGMTPAVSTFDFVLARKDVSTDGRHAVTEPGTLADDLARRDFTMNAIALAQDGTLIDPHGGRADIAARSLCTVGFAKQRMREDGLRTLRAVRFAVVLGFDMTPSLKGTLLSHGMWFATQNVHENGIREELLRMFKFDTIRSLQVLAECNMLELVTFGDLWLMPTSKAR